MANNTIPSTAGSLIATMQQQAAVFPLQAAQTGNANGMAQSIDGFNTTNVQVSEANVGTATVTLQGSMDDINWFAIRYQRVDNTAAPTPAVTGIAVAQNSVHVYEILTRVPYLRAVTSANSGSVTVTAYCIPV